MVCPGTDNPTHICVMHKQHLHCFPVPVAARDHERSLEAPRTHHTARGAGSLPGGSRRVELRNGVAGKAQNVAQGVHLRA